MSSLHAVVGHIVEGDKPGYFYSRLGHWVKYGSVAEGFVWDDAHVAAIHKAGEADKSWKIKPKTVYPAIYDDTHGVTVVTGEGHPIGKAELSRAAAITVPNTGGEIFNLERTVARLGGHNIKFSMVSL